MLWIEVLPWRRADKAEKLGALFEDVGLTAGRVGEILADPAEFAAAAMAREPGWRGSFGGEVGVALLAAELSERATAERIGYAAIRAESLGELAARGELSIADIARSVGVSRQFVSRMSRNPNSLLDLVVPHVRRAVVDGGFIQSVRKSSK